MARAKQAGHRVVLVLATRGELGEPVPGVLHVGEELGARRSDEARASAAILGVDRVEFLGYRDSGMIGEASNDDERCFWQADVDTAAARLATILTDEDASVVCLYDDHGGYGHPDHIQVHRVGVRAAAIVATPKVFQMTMNRDRIMSQMTAGELGDEFEERRASMDMNAFGSPEAIITHAIDVREYVDRKRAAMLAHASQIAPDSFFLQMPEQAFADAFGWEWFIEYGQSRNGVAFGADLFS